MTAWEAPGGIVSYSDMKHSNNSVICLPNEIKRSVEVTVRCSDVRYSDKSAIGGMIKNENWSEIGFDPHNVCPLCMSNENASWSPTAAGFGEAAEYGEILVSVFAHT